MAGMLRNLIESLWPDAGLNTARRNAWAAMAADAMRTRERAEAARLLERQAAVATAQDLRVASRA